MVLLSKVHIFRKFRLLHSKNDPHLNCQYISKSKTIDFDLQSHKLKLLYQSMMCVNCPNLSHFKQFIITHSPNCQAVSFVVSCKMKRFKGLKPILKAVIFIACFSFVGWQCYLSFEKFLEKPRGTSLSLEFANKWPFPRFTICPMIAFLRRNEDVLNDCGFHGSFGYKKYTDQGYWTGLGYDDNCTDPKKLYENAMNRPEDILHYAKIWYYSKPGYSKTIRTNSSWWKPIHKLKYGRCYELDIPKENLANGIRILRFYFLYRSGKLAGKTRIFSHVPGYFLANKNEMYKDMTKGQKIKMDFDHIVGKVVKVGGENCNPDVEYSVDDCIHEVLFNASIFSC